MLYATTRNNSNIETAYKSIHLDCSADGGLFTPFRLTKFSRADIVSLQNASFAENMAQILNHFFSAGLTARDMEFAIGRNPMGIHSITHRIFVAELWHNSQWKFDYFLQSLTDRLRGDQQHGSPSNWVRIAVRIAALFATYGQLLATEQIDMDTVMDVAVVTGDFEGPMAAWYAREMGLPVGNVICGCNANGGVWDLLHHGEMSTGGVAVRTSTPDADVVVPRDLERLVYLTLGREETHRYLDKCRMGGIYALHEEQLALLSKGMFAAVISDDRVNSIIHSVYRTSSYVFGPYSALAYGSLLDYRAKTGESRPVLLISERSPICDSEQVAKAMQVPVAELIKRINIS